MQHLIALAIKFVMIAAILGIFLPMLADVTLANAVLVALAVTVVSYIVGDLYVLPAWGNWPAVIADLFLAALVIWGMQFMLLGLRLTFTQALIAGALIAAGEYFLHRYLRRTLIADAKPAQS